MCLYTWAHIYTNTPPRSMYYRDSGVLDGTPGKPTPALLMLDGVGGEIHGADVVAVDERALGERAVELRQELS